MADIDYTNPTLATTFTSTQVDANFANVRTVVNGGIDTTNVSTTAGITNGQLANDDYEFVVAMRVVAGDIVAAGSATPVAMIALPGTSTDGDFTVRSGTWLCMDVGDQTTDFRLEWGEFTAAGAWSVIATLATVNNLAANTGVNEGIGEGAITFAATALVMSATEPRYLALVFPAATGAGFLTGGANNLLHFTVALKIRRTNGLFAG